MQKLLKLSALIAGTFGILVLTIQGQTAEGAPPEVNLSGIWVLDAPKWSGGDKMVLEIEQDGDLVKIVETHTYKKKDYVNRATIYTDGRGESNLLWIREISRPSEVRSVSQWRNGKLIRRSSYSVDITDGRRQSVSNHSKFEEFKLSKDGETLTVNTNTTTDFRSVDPAPTQPVGRNLPASTSAEQRAPATVYPIKRTFRKKH